MSTTAIRTDTAPEAIETFAAPRGNIRRPFLASITLALCDLTALTIAMVAGYLVWRLANPQIPAPRAIVLMLPLCTVLQFVFSGHYPGFGLSEVEHIRRSCRGVTAVYLLFTASMFLSKGLPADSRGAAVLAWAFSLVAVPASRWWATSMLAAHSRWGVPVIVVGAGETARAVIQNLRRHPVLGYRPVACVDDNKVGDCDGVPVVGPLSRAPAIAGALGARHAIVAIPHLERERLIWYLRRWRQYFPSILLIPNLAGIASLWTETRDLGGLLSLEIHHNLHNEWNQRCKRAVDIVVSALGLVLAAPLLGLCAWRIKRASNGSAFFTQEREGQNGKIIRIRKLRTMYPDAERMLRDHLAVDPAARAEWDRFCKLKRDPRILPGVGHFLRKTSLDELPQLWNVLKGEMSLVGPRPFPEYHNARFDPEFRWVRTRVKPGLTGFWQVSARSDGDLEVQESLDSYYIRNWSLWLDVYILVRTIRTVAARQGAC